MRASILFAVLLATAGKGLPTPKANHDDILAADLDRRQDTGSSDAWPEGLDKRQFSNPPETYVSPPGGPGKRQFSNPPETYVSPPGGPGS